MVVDDFSKVQLHGSAGAYRLNARAPMVDNRAARSQPPRVRTPMRKDPGKFTGRPTLQLRHLFPHA